MGEFDLDPDTDLDLDAIDRFVRVYDDPTASPRGTEDIARGFVEAVKRVRASRWQVEDAVDARFVSDLRTRLIRYLHHVLLVETERRAVAYAGRVARQLAALDGGRIDAEFHATFIEQARAEDAEASVRSAAREMVQLLLTDHAVLYAVGRMLDTPDVRKSEKRKVELSVFLKEFRMLGEWDVKRLRDLGFGRLDPQPSVAYYGAWVFLANAVELRDVAHLY